MSSPLTPIAACRQPQNRHACQLEIRSPGLQVATVTDLVSLAREKRPELVVVDIRIPPTRTTEGLDTARVITRSCPTSASWCSPRTSKSAMRWQIGSRGLATSQSVYCPLPHGRPQTEARLPASVHRGRSGRGRRHDLSILQAEFSLTQMLDTPTSGRIFLEQVIRDNLDIGRPDQVGLVFDPRPIRRGPRATPGRFRTRVITAGVTPSLHVDDKHTTIKQSGKAPRTETTITDTNDFGIGKRPTNLPALREIGDTANRRLSASNESATSRSPGPDALHTVTAPVTTATGTRIPGLRPG